MNEKVETLGGLSRLEYFVPFYFVAEGGRL